MVRNALIAVVSAAAMVSGGGVMRTGGSGGAQGIGFHCTDGTIQGTYGIQMTGTIPVPPALGGGIQTVIGVVVRNYDGAGSFTQVDNIKGSVTGIVPDRPGAGTYQVNADCSVVALFQPGPGITVEERMVIVDHGNEIRSIASSPLGIMTSSVQKRVR